MALGKGLGALLNTDSVLDNVFDEKNITEIKITQKERMPGHKLIILCSVVTAFTSIDYNYRIIIFKSMLNYTFSV